MRDRETETDRQTDRQRRETESERETVRERESVCVCVCERQTDRQTDRQRYPDDPVHLSSLIITLRLFIKRSVLLRLWQNTAFRFQRPPLFQDLFIPITDKNCRPLHPLRRTEPPSSKALG